MRRYGHTRKARGKGFTASALIAAALKRLSVEGGVLFKVGKATGFWAYNSDVSYWALPPGPADDAVMTYAEYATSRGLDPNA